MEIHESRPFFLLFSRPSFDIVDIFVTGQAVLDNRLINVYQYRYLPSAAAQCNDERTQNVIPIAGG
jgi:hypothetical protein